MLHKFEITLVLKNPFRIIWQLPEIRKFTHEIIISHHYSLKENRPHFLFQKYNGIYFKSQKLAPISYCCEMISDEFDNDKQ